MTPQQLKQLKQKSLLYEYLTEKEKQSLFDLAMLGLHEMSVFRKKKRMSDNYDSDLEENYHKEIMKDFDKDDFGS